MRTEWHVAPGSNGEKLGTAAQPFATIARAQNAVRTAIANGMTADATVFLHAGSYYLDAALAFDARDSGRDGFHVVYRNAPGATPAIVGGQPITDWQHDHGHVYKTHVGADWRFSTLFENGERATMARWPKSGYNTVERKVEGHEATHFVYRANDLPDEWEASDAQVYIWPGETEWNWFSQTQPVTQHDREARTIAMQQPAPWGIHSDARYFVQGARAFLTAPGEFHLDTAHGDLYYWPRQTPIEAQAIIAPTTRRVLSLQGATPEQPVRNLRFEGLTLAISDFGPAYRLPLSPAQDNDEWDEAREGLVYFENAEACELRFCTIRNAGFSAVLLNKHAQHNRIYGNQISGVGYNGVYLTGWGAGQGSFANAEASYVNKHNVVVNNRITDGGMLVGHGSGIQLLYSGDNEIAHNEIARFPRYGVSLKGLRHKLMAASYFGTPVTWDNHYDFLHARNNHIHHNDISAVMQDSQDGGIIEAWGPGRGNLIDSNHLHHSGIHLSYGFGVYLDDAADDFTVTNNLIHDLYATGTGRLWMVLFIKGIGNVIRNNIIADNAAEAAIGSMEMAGEENRDLVIEQNIIVNSGTIYHFNTWSEQRFARADRNIVFNDHGAYAVSGCPHATTWFEWQTILDQRYDQHSLIADPAFEDAANRDYHLRPDSPAYALGFQPMSFEDGVLAVRA